MDERNNIQPDEAERINEESRLANHMSRRDLINRIMLLLNLFGGIFVFGMLSGTRSIVLALIRAEFNVSYDTQGTMLFFSTIVSMVFTYGAAILLRKFGTKVSASINFLTVAIACIAMQFTTIYPFVMIVYMVIYATYSHFGTNKNAIFRSIFTAKFALWMSLLHAFFGLGSVAGPYLTSYLINELGYGWQHVYFVLALPMVVFLIIAVFARYIYSEETVDHKVEEKSDVGGTYKLTVRECFKMPIVWIFAVSIAFAGAIEYSFSNWTLIYLKDMFGVDPVTTGAMLMSVYFIAFTASRIVGGFFMEKIGYIRTLRIFAVFEIGLLVTSFLLGESGIWVLPIVGFFVGPFYPTQLASMLKVYGREATIMIGASGIISALLTSIIQYGIGWTNTLVGPAWGFRSIAAYGLLSLIIHTALGKSLAKKYGKPV